MNYVNLLATGCLSFAGGYLLARLLNKKEMVFDYLKSLPIVSSEINKEKDKLRKGLEETIFEGLDISNVCEAIPEEGWDKKRVLARIECIRDSKMYGDKLTGAVYIRDEELDELIGEVYKLTLRTNPLHINLCGLIRQMEAEIIRMVSNLYHGDSDVCGNVTNGGTASIRHAVYTARNRAITRGYKQFEMVLPISAHSAFRKAAFEYGITVVDWLLGVDMKADTNNLEPLITSNTILVVGSCPQFPHGQVDPIEEVAKVLEKMDPGNNICLHVDCCLGSFVVPFLEGSAYELPTRFDFRIPRVTSISMDTHKYGYADKGTSVVLYRNHEDYRRHQIFVDNKWQGGIYATPTLPGSRSGKDIAGTWAVLVYTGMKKYRTLARLIVKLTHEIHNVIDENEHLKLIGEGQVMVVAFGSKNPDELNIYDLKSEMSKKEWYLSSLQDPDSIHLCVTAVHVRNENFLGMFKEELEECIKIVLNYPEEKRSRSGDAVMYRSNHSLGKKEFVPDLAKYYWNVCGQTLPTLTNTDKSV